MSCEGWDRCAHVVWPDEMTVACPKCGCALCVDVERVELLGAGARILWKCGHYGCGHTWYESFAREIPDERAAKEKGLARYVQGNFTARFVQFRAFLLIRAAQAWLACPRYRPLLRCQLRRDFEEELRAFEKYVEKFEEAMHDG